MSEPHRVSEPKGKPLTLSEANHALYRQGQKLAWAMQALRNISMMAIHNHWTGAQWLQCPACYARYGVTEGYAFNEQWYPGHPLEHTDDCPIQRAWDEEEGSVDPADVAL